MKLRQEIFCLTLIVVACGCVAAAEEKPSLIEASGVVEPFKRITIGARATGVVESIAAEEGAVVKEDDVLAKLDSELDQHDMAYYSSQARNYAAASKAYKELQGSEAVLKIMEAVSQGEMAEARLKSAQKKFLDKTVRAPAIGVPMSGIVLRRFKQVGESVEERGDLFELIYVDTVYFTAFFEAKDFSRVKVGQKATVTLEGDATQSFVGKVQLVDPAVDAGSGQFRVKIFLDNRDHRITAGLKGSVRLGEVSGNVSARQ